MRIDFQQHGYVHGHQLLATSIVLDKRDQETINRLSDISGPIGPGEEFPPYLTGYPLPSGLTVFARTWPDREARRAGCVRTQSLILATDDWASMPSPASLLNLVAEMPIASSGKLEHVSVEPGHVRLPPVGNPLVTGLIEALFLEDRKPIVCFQETEAETTALRLVEALWPALRRQFAFCTFALQARTIESRPFDLLFAPKVARSRFSDWPGRKLDRASGRPTARHAWSADLAAAIFTSPEPDLRIADQLGVLTSDREGNATALRLAMLWRDLEVKSLSDPTAVLGMLDVLTAAAIPVEQKIRHATKAFGIAADRMQRGMDPVHGMQLLRLLLTKLPAQAHQGSTADQTEAVSEKLVSQDPSSSTVVLDLIPSDLFEARSLARGVGDGLARSSRTQDAYSALSGTSPEALRALIMESHALLGLVMSESASETDWWDQVPIALDAASPSEITQIRMMVLAQTKAAQHATLVPIMFRTASPAEIAIGLDVVLSSPGAALPLIQQALGETLLPDHRSLLRAAVLEQSRQAPALDELLLHALEPKGQDLGWLVNEPHIDAGRRLNLLKAYLGRTTDVDIGRLMRTNPDWGRAALTLLVADPKADGTAAARMLISSPELVVGFEDELLRMCSILPQRLLLDLLASVLPALFDSISSNSWPSVRALVASDKGAAVIATMKTGVLISALAGAKASPEQQALIMKLVGSLPRSHPLPEYLVRHIVALTKRLASKSVSDLGDGTIDVWAGLLDQAVREKVPDMPAAAANALGYSLRNPVAHLSPLVRAAFPVVLWEADQPKSPFDYWSRLMGYDVDNAKEIRERIVTGYLSAKWPATDLLHGAWIVDAAPKVVRMLKRSRRGTDFLGAALNAFKRDKRAPKRLVELIKQELSGGR